MADGSRWETQAEAWLHQQGLRLLHRNYRCRMGEIDLVMQDGDMLVFVEVRRRFHAGFGGAAASVDWRKRQRIVLAARNYLLRLGQMPACRFDVVAFEGDCGQPVWYRNAFQAE